MRRARHRLQPLACPSGRAVSLRRLALAVLLVLLARPAAGEAIQLQQRGGGYLIAGQVNGAISIDFILDTGASDVLIPGDVAKALERSGTLTQRDFIGTRTYVLADGSRLPSARIVLRELRVGSQVVRNVTASIGPARTTPLLGQSFLAKFPSWTLDNERRVLVLADRTNPQEPSGPTPERLSGGTAFGAVAYDRQDGRYGFSWNHGTAKLADEAALRGCAADKCEIVFRLGAKQCGALATAAGGNAWGGASRLARPAAEEAALDNCRKRTEAGCKLRGSVCNR